MKKLDFGEKSFMIDAHIEQFDVYQKPSSNVDFFGIDVTGERFFIQFKNGSSYIFNDVPKEVLTDSVEDGSIGKYFSAKICKKYSSVKFEYKLVKEADYAG